MLISFPLKTLPPLYFKHFITAVLHLSQLGLGCSLTLLISSNIYCIAQENGLDAVSSCLNCLIFFLMFFIIDKIRLWQFNVFITSSKFVRYQKRFTFGWKLYDLLLQKTLKTGVYQLFAITI